MSIDIIRVRNGLVFAGVAGLGAGLAGMAALALLVAPGVNLMQAWEVTASELLLALIVGNTVGFVYGYRLNRSSNR